MRPISGVVDRITLAFLRLRQGLTIGSGTRLRGVPSIVVAKGATVAVGRDCLIISRSSDTALGVQQACLIRSMRPGALVSIGVGCRISGAVICAAERIEIGAGALLGSGALVCDTDFHPLGAGARVGSDLGATKPVSIGEDVFVGARAIILKGVSLGRDSVIGAGAVVAADVAPGAIVAGNPARQVGSVYGAPR